jgi:hypothetical protein
MKMTKGKRSSLAPSQVEFSTKRSNGGDNEEYEFKFKSGSRNTADRFSTMNSNRGLMNFNKTQQNGFKSIDLKQRNPSKK